MKTIYCDMDGVLADFNAEKNAVERFAVEKGFFMRLKPIRKNLIKIKRLIKQGFDVKIISASPNLSADIDKLAWVRKYLPELTIHDVIITRVGENKAEYVKDIENAILLDDYGKNCAEWRSSGGIAFKIKDVISNNQVKLSVKG